MLRLCVVWEVRLSQQRAAAEGGVQPLDDDDSTTYNTRLTAHGDDGRWEQASAVCAEMSAAGVKPTVATCDALLTAYAREGGGHWDRALDVFLAMRAAGVQPAGVTYNALIAAYGDGGQWERARAVFGAVKAAGVVPDVSTYNAMIALYNNCRQLELVTALVEEMWEETGVEFNEFTFNAVMTAYGNCGQCDYLPYMLNMMQDEGWTPGDAAYHALINAHGTALVWGEEYGNQWEGALAAFEEMKAVGVQPDVRAYTILMDAYGNGLQWERALAAYDDMKAAGMQPDVGTYNVLLDACTKAAQPERAMATLEEMKVAGVAPDRDTYNTLIALHALTSERGRWERALAVFDEMKAAGVQPDVGTYDMLLSVLWLCGQRRTAIELYLEASKAGVYNPQASLETLILDTLPLGPALAATTLWLDAIAATALQSPTALPEKLVMELPVYAQVSPQSIHHVDEFCVFHEQREACAEDDCVIPGWDLRRHSCEDVVSVKFAPSTSFMKQLESPFKLRNDVSGMEADRDAVCAWLARLGPVIPHVCGDAEAATRASERRAGRRARGLRRCNVSAV